MTKFNDIFSKKWQPQLEQKATGALKSFSLTEKVVFAIASLVLVVSSFYLLQNVSNALSVEVPAHGGTLTEGIVGSSRFINPLLALSDTDRDLTALTYSGLLKATPAGELVPDLAQSYSVSPDGLVYDFILKDNIYFHDNQKVTADDVIFTLEEAQDPNLKSPRRANWDGVKIEKVNDKEIRLTLKVAYSPFLQNTTIGILPKHIWKDIPVEQFPFSTFNIEPIGSGPYQMKQIERGANGIPLSYTFNAFKKYAGGEAYISNLIVKFYQSEDDLLTAYKAGEIESLSAVSPERMEELAKTEDSVEKVPLPRVFGVFFNQNEQPIFAQREVRQALNLAAPKNQIVNQVLKGFGQEIDGPIPPGALTAEELNRLNTVSPVTSAATTTATSTKTTTSTTPKTVAPKVATPLAIVLDPLTILTKAGWSMSTTTKVMEKKTKTGTLQLKFTLATSNAPELKETADILKAAWEKLGAQVDVKVYEPGDLNQNVIRPRKYDALLFGEIIGRDLDLYAFWHSSQRNDPGLNIALYTNVKADKALEQSRSITDEMQRIDALKNFETEVQNDIPAVFLYSPDFIYLIPPKLHGFELGEVTVPAERFSNIRKWFIETDKVWKIFAPYAR